MVAGIRPTRDIPNEGLPTVSVTPTGRPVGVTSVADFIVVLLALVYRRS